MTDEDILKYFSKWKCIPWKRIDNNIKTYLKNRYKDSLSILESYLRIKYNIEERPVCPVCGKPVKFYGRQQNIFSQHCSTRCSTLDSNVQYKLKQTNLKLYGTNYVSQSELIKNKSKQSCLERYGVEHYTNREKYSLTYRNKSKEEKQQIIKKSKQTKLERYGDENYNNIKKSKQTCLEKYGYYINIDKIRQTCLKKYGVDNIRKTEYCKQKIKQTKLEKYKNENYNNIEKIKETCLKKYGVTNPLKNKIVRNKIKQTCLERYGVIHHMKNPDIVKKFNFDIMSIKRIKSMIKNNTLNSSKPEKQSYILLKEKYPDILRQYRSELYPFNCDFYIPSLDLYIECQYGQFHHQRPYIGNEKDLKDVEILKERANRIHKQNNVKKSRYDAELDTWTIRDVKKRNVAKQNNLNYIEFWNIDELKNWLNKS